MFLCTYQRKKKYFYGACMGNLKNQLCYTVYTIYLQLFFIIHKNKQYT